MATTNYPEAIDERLVKRPGRLDRVFVIPTIQDEEQAEAMLRHYMGEHWQNEHIEIVAQLVDQPGAFVREVALQARMLAAHESKTEVDFNMLEKSVDTLAVQMDADKDFLVKRRPIGLGVNARPSPLRRRSNDRG